MIELRALAEADLPALLALWDGGTALELRGSLYDAARDFGRRVVVAVRGGAVVGCAGWVEAGPWCYGAPVIAADEAAAAAVLVHLVEQARAAGAARVRVSAAAGEAGKRAALAAAGFVPVFDFIWFARPVRPGDGARREVPWPRVPHARLDPDRFRAVHNLTFEGVANAKALTREEVVDLLDAPLTDRRTTAAWEAGDRYVAFLHTEREDDIVTIAAIGVDAAVRGQGVAQAILDDLLSRAADEGVRELRALIASVNAPSLALHTGRGFVETSRRTVFEAPTRA